jgi:hypothetical protein
VSANILKELMRDGIHQFGQLTGENLETYSRTWSALAEKMLNNPENTYTPEVRALVQAAKKVEVWLAAPSVKTPVLKEMQDALHTALTSFTESPSEPLTPTKDRVMKTALEMIATYPLKHHMTGGGDAAHRAMVKIAIAALKSSQPTES